MVRGDVTKGFVLGFATCLLLMFYTSFFMKCSDNVCDQRQQQLLDENVRQTIGKFTVLKLLTNKFRNKETNE